MIKYLIPLLLFLTACGGMDHSENKEAENVAFDYIYPPAQYFAVFSEGRPVANAQIYIGNVNQDPEIESNQKQAQLVLQSGARVNVAQPIRTGAGGVVEYEGSPAQITADGDYSIKVLSQYDEQIYYFAEVKASGIPSANEQDSIVLIDGTPSNPAISWANYPSDGFYHDGVSIRVKYGATDLPVGTQPETWQIEERDTAQDFTLASSDDGTHFVLTGSGTYNITIDSNSSTGFTGAPKVKFTINNNLNDTVVNILNGVQVEFDRDDYKLTKHLSSVEMYWSDFRSSVDYWEGRPNFIKFNDTDKTIDYDDANNRYFFGDSSDDYLRVPTSGSTPAQVREPKTDSLRDITTEYDRLYEQTVVSAQPWVLNSTFRRRHNVTLDNLEISLNPTSSPSIFSPQQIHTQNYDVTVIQNGAAGLVDLSGDPIPLPFVIPQGQLWEFEGSTGGNYKAYRVDQPNDTPEYTGFIRSGSTYYNQQYAKTITTPFTRGQTKTFGSSAATSPDVVFDLNNASFFPPEAKVLILKVDLEGYIANPVSNHSNLEVTVSARPRGGAITTLDMMIRSKSRVEAGEIHFLANSQSSLMYIPLDSNQDYEIQYLWGNIAETFTSTNLTLTYMGFQVW